MVAQLTVEGLTEWRKALRSVDLVDAVKDVNQRAAQFVVVLAEQKKARLQARYPSYKKVTLKASRTQRGAQVIVGPKTVGKAGEFGAIVHPVFGRDIVQTTFRRRVWPVWSGRGKGAGLMVFPTIEENREEIIVRYGQAVTESLKVAFPEE